MFVNISFVDGTGSCYKLDPDRINDFETDLGGLMRFYLDSGDVLFVNKDHVKEFLVGEDE